jgi:photosystem II stability/assembly factor-like uncharacterized protein
VRCGERRVPDASTECSRRHSWATLDTFVAQRKTLHAISCPKPDACWAVGDLGTGVLHTLDGGGTWELQTMRTVTWQVTVVSHPLLSARFCSSPT